MQRRHLIRRAARRLISRRSVIRLHPYHRILVRRHDLLDLNGVCLLFQAQYRLRLFRCSGSSSFHGALCKLQLHRRTRPGLLEGGLLLAAQIHEYARVLLFRRQHGRRSLGFNGAQGVQVRAYELGLVRLGQGDLLFHARHDRSVIGSHLSHRVSVPPFHLANMVVLLGLDRNSLVRGVGLEHSSARLCPLRHCTQGRVVLGLERRDGLRVPLCRLGERRAVQRLRLCQGVRGGGLVRRVLQRHQSPALHRPAHQPAMHRAPKLPQDHCLSRFVVYLLRHALHGRTLHHGLPTMLHRIMHRHIMHPAHLRELKCVQPLHL